MTTAMASASLESVLTQVAQRGLARMDLAAVKAAALAVWYGTETPNFADLQGPHAADAMQLVERLSYYNLVPQPRKKALLGRVRVALSAHKDVARADFEATYKTFLPQLQPLQTRHYAAWA